MHDSYIKLARILRTKPEVIFDYSEKLTEITGKTGVIEKIIQENDVLVNRTLEELGVPADQRHFENVYTALVDRLQHMDDHLFEHLGRPNLAELSNVCGKLCETAIDLVKPPKGFFVKKERAIELLSKYPPQNLLDYFRFTTVQQLIDAHGFAPVFSSLRFAQSNEWMHHFFDTAYQELKPEDFEERDVEMLVLNTEWLKVAEKFLVKKYHNVSHLKELGIIFIVPIKLDIPGETMRMFTLLLHYLNEVAFYSKLFRKFAKEEGFIKNLQSLLRGDVPKEKIQNTNDKFQIRIVQQYLAKDDENDFRLLEPHVNPEAEHWWRAEGDFGKLKLAEAGHAMGYWQGLDFVGEFFADTAGKQQLLGFDLIDIAMSLAKKGEVKYLYHQEESLWNKILVEYLGRDEMNRLIEENIIKGFITL